MPASRHMAQNGAVAKSAWRDDASAGCPAMLTMAADREKARQPRRFKSQPPAYPMERAPEPARVASHASTRAKLHCLPPSSPLAPARAPRDLPLAGEDLR